MAIARWLSAIRVPLNLSSTTAEWKDRHTFEDPAFNGTLQAAGRIRASVWSSGAHERCSRPVTARGSITSVSVSAFQESRSSDDPRGRAGGL